MLRSKAARAFVTIALTGLTLSVASSSTAAKPGPPTLRLVSVLPQVSAVRFGSGNHFYVSPGVYVAAVGGAFEVDAVKAPDGNVALWQVTRDSHGVHQLRQITPAAPVHLFAGLPDFFQLTLQDAQGDVVATQSLSFCPSAGYGQARVDPAGPVQPTYPYWCGSRLTHASVWGIDNGWASPLFFGLRFGAPDGLYKMTIAVAPTYVQQFGFEPTDVTASLMLKVRTRSGVKCLPGRPCIAAAVLPHTSPSTPGGEGPQATPGTPTDPALGPTADGTPDMRALPAHDLSIAHNTRTGRDYLAFGATIWNGGSGPLVVEGFRNGAAETMSATQFIYRDGQPVDSQVVGQFEFDKRRGHHHWHMEDIAQYDLLDRTGNRVVLSDKQSFCLAPTDPIDLTAPGAEWRPDNQGLWSACEGETAIWLREVMPAGWGDTYYQSVAGQSFDITEVPNGHYTVRVTADPLHHLLETSYDNNVGLLDIALKGSPGHRTVVVG